MADDLSASDRPIGTVEEAQALNLPLNNFATCSRPHGPGNKGCRFFDTCEFRPIRDGILEHLDTRTQRDFINGRGSGPDYIGFQRKVGSNNAMQGLWILCQDWYTGGNDDRRKDVRGTGDAFSPPVYAGGTITERIHVSPHRYGPNQTEEDKEQAAVCPECKRGDCQLVEERVRKFTVPKFRRPADAMKDVVFGNEIEQQMREAMEKSFYQQGMESLVRKPETAAPDLSNPHGPTHEKLAPQSKGVRHLRSIPDDKLGDAP